MAALLAYVGDILTRKCRFPNINAIGQPLSEQQLERFCFQHVPVVGALSYSAFSTNILAYKAFDELFTSRHLVVANCLLLNSHLGIGLYLFNTRTIRAVNTRWRVTWSVYGSAMFNFGSILLWATVKEIIPENAVLRVGFGVLSSVFFLMVGKKYLDHVDANLKLAKSKPKATEQK
ncbi:PREDICTED: uncharacterized protein LOC109466711 [Branchiostoma belcheri]|uniref:Uncharacterized protein LOC109466711 n=1 Tax=Branchiostoma belcheri TaxID=7741 RepID=A0A6P4Y6G1_BRABE|nr:PREDICTED: uncharacterized protein LOC109466711 [Branchiostoma belcheri]